MSQKKDTNEAAIAYVVIGGVIAIALFVFFLIALAAFVLTLLCIGVRIANKPQHLGGGNWITPQEAEEFLQRGVIGAVTVPLFLIVVQFFAEGGLYYATVQSLPGAAAFGYVLFSMVPLLENADLPQTKCDMEVLPPQPRFPTLDEQMRMNARKEEPPPFRYARWDDDDVRD